jgi:hypothetical protein
MSAPVDPQAFLKLCEISIDNMYELEALKKLLEEKGFLHKQEILDRAKLLKKQTNQSIPSSPEAQPMTDKENVVIKQIMEVILQSGLSSQQVKTLLERTNTLLELGQKPAPKTTH